MIAPLAKLMDWSAIQAVTLMMPPDCMQRPRLEEALEFLKGPEFIPNKSQPARVEFDPVRSGMHFRFSSPDRAVRAAGSLQCTTKSGGASVFTAVQFGQSLSSARRHREKWHKI